MKQSEKIAIEFTNEIIQFLINYYHCSYNVISKSLEDFGMWNKLSDDETACTGASMTNSMGDLVKDLERGGFSEILSRNCNKI